MSTQKAELIDTHNARHCTPHQRTHSSVVACFVSLSLIGIVCWSCVHTYTQLIVAYSLLVVSFTEHTHNNPKVRCAMIPCAEHYQHTHRICVYDHMTIVSLCLYLPVINWIAPVNCTTITNASPLQCTCIKIPLRLQPFKYD